MTIDEMINDLQRMKNEVGGDALVAVVRLGYGENDYIIPDYGITGHFEDQNQYKFRCAFVGKTGGSEFTEKGTAHYKWVPHKQEKTNE